MKNRLTLPLLVVVLFFSNTTLAEGPPVFSTWEGFEADKLASIWLIKRHIEPGARILIYPKNEEIDKGISFDTPYSDIKRDRMRSTYESLLAHYGLDDPRLVNLGKIIHDIEINVWEKKVYRKSSRVRLCILDLMEKHSDQTSLLEGAEQYFDDLYENMPAELEMNARP
ncbi:MAG: chromate resistance protein ChrB domain-containing protein [Desulfatibacillaceae bacterium]